MFPRCLRPAAAGVVSLYAIFWGADIARAQRTTVDEKFRQTTEAMRQARLDEAAEGFSTVITASPTLAEAYFNLGLVREEQGRNEEAIARFEKALALKPRVPTRRSSSKPGTNWA
jgi:Flp pilus assembly protein TadD